MKKQKEPVILDSEVRYVNCVKVHQGKKMKMLFAVYDISDDVSAYTDNPGKATTCGYLADARARRKSWEHTYEITSFAMLIRMVE